MMTAVAILPIADAVSAASILQQPPHSAGFTGGSTFAGLLSGGLQSVSDDVLQAEKLSQQFALSDSIPVHQVTYALEQARLSLDLMVQIRNRLLDGYQQLMNMQL